MTDAAIQLRAAVAGRARPALDGRLDPRAESMTGASHVCDEMSGAY
jgi:hypothetical protein